MLTLAGFPTHNLSFCTPGSSRKNLALFSWPGVTRDKPLDQLDLPRDSSHPIPKGFQAERRQLQAAYREGLRQSEHLWHEPDSDTDLELKTERIKDEFYGLRRGSQRLQKGVFAGVVCTLVLLGTILVIQRAMKKEQQSELRKITDGQKVTKARIRAHLLEASESLLKEQHAQAEQSTDWERREELKEAARRAHVARLARIDELAENFALIESSDAATSVFSAFTRILTRDGVDASLTYIARQRTELLRRVQNRTAHAHDQNRSDLLPLLKGASLQAVKGRAELARKSFQEVLDLDPIWTEAMHDFAWFLLTESMRDQFHGSLKGAIADARQALEYAGRLTVMDPRKPAVQRLHAVALSQMAQVLAERGLAEDGTALINHFNQSLEVLEGLLETNPKSILITRGSCVEPGKNGRLSSSARVAGGRHTGPHQLYAQLGTV